MDFKEELFEICETIGVSGFEQERGRLISEHLKRYCDNVWTNKSGNVIGHKKGNGTKKIMISAHMDEIGLMVSNIDKKGLISVTNIGGFDPRTLVSQCVKILGREVVKGVIGGKPKHQINSKDSTKAVKLEDLKIDTGLAYEEVIKLISIGDVAVVDKEYLELLNNRISGRAMDDIIGVISMYYALDYLKNYNHEADIYFVAATQEEVGCRGSITASEEVKPDIGLAVDVTFAKTPELSDVETQLGKGPTFSYSPSDNRKVVKELMNVAKENKIDYQLTVRASYSGTETFSMQIAGMGVATANVSIPLRYMHTSVEVIDMQDVKEVGRLLANYIMSLNGVDVEEYLCF